MAWPHYTLALGRGLCASSAAREPGTCAYGFTPARICPHAAPAAACARALRRLQRRRVLFLVWRTVSWASSGQRRNLRHAQTDRGAPHAPFRSEERRVGEEGRSR